MKSFTGRQGAIKAYVALEIKLREFINEEITESLKEEIQLKAEQTYTKDGLYEINSDPLKGYITYLGKVN